MNFEKLFTLVECFFLVMPISGICNTQENLDKETKKADYCLDHRCDGDIEPKYDLTRDVALKLNGAWFVGPSRYFSTAGNRSTFEWWNHKPVDRNLPRPAELQALINERKNTYSSIEIWISSVVNRVQPISMYEQLVQAEKDDRVLSKTNLTKDLQVWRVQQTKGSPNSGLWYIAEGLRDIDGQRPVIRCGNNTSAQNQCATSFQWQPQIYARMRLYAVNAKDWPEIFQETNRVLGLLRKVEK